GATPIRRSALRAQWRTAANSRRRLSMAFATRAASSGRSGSQGSAGSRASTTTSEGNSPRSAAASGRKPLGSASPLPVDDGAALIELDGQLEAVGGQRAVGQPDPTALGIFLLVLGLSKRLDHHFSAGALPGLPGKDELGGVTPEALREL